MKKILFTLTSVFLSVLVMGHLPPYLKDKKLRNDTKANAADCTPATAIGQLSFNNVRARIENGGNMWQNRANNTPFYEIPKNGGVHSIYSGALWMGGIGPNGQLKIAAITFRSNGDDFYAGPLSNDGNGEITPDVCNKFDRFWKASKTEALTHRAYWSLYGDGSGEAAAKAAFPDYDPNGPKSFDDWRTIASNTSVGYDKELAPYFDWNDDGEYTPEAGDYPGYDLTGTEVCRDSSRRVPLFGDTTIYWIFNDKGNIHTNTNGESIGMEIRGQAFAFADQTAINNMTFCNYVMINQGSQTLTQTYFGQWVDTDLGGPLDDYVGCDVQRGLGYTYNGNNTDADQGDIRGYGDVPPAVGIDFFQGPYQDDDGFDNYGPYDPILAPFGDKNVTYDNTIAGVDSLNLGPNGIPYKGLGIGYGDGVIDNERFGMRKFIYHSGQGAPGNETSDPRTAQDHYGYLSGFWKDGADFVYGGNAHFPSNNGSGYPVDEVAADALCDFMFPGDTDPVNFGSRGVDYPGQNGGILWTETTANNPVGDRRFLQSAGPFTLTPGQVNNITVGVVWARATNGDNLASVAKLKEVDDIAQSLFDNCFQIFEGPDAPDVDLTELDREIIITLSNSPSSNNFGEQYSKVRPIIPEDSDDRTYEFEGYQVFQLKDASVSVTELDNPDVARLVSQSDIINFEKDDDGNILEDSPIGKLINYEEDPEVNLPIPRVKVDGANSGLVKAIRITQDQFATGDDRRLVNYKPYYFVAIAYGYNEYEKYNPASNEGQFEPYVPSRKSGTGGGIQAVSGIPRKRTNQEGGTKINANFGDQLPITRLEGKGNGGNYVKLTKESEAKIMDGEPWVEDVLDYERGFGPVNVSVVDPLNVVPADYTLVILDTNDNFYLQGAWLLRVENLQNGMVDTITSDQTIDIGGQQLVIANVGDGGTSLNMGVAVNLTQVAYEQLQGTLSFRADFYTDPISASITYAETAKLWLSGLQDTDGETVTNWIRSGNVTNGAYVDASIERNGGAGEQGVDALGAYENLLNRMWSPGRLLASTPNDALSPTLYLLPREAINQNSTQSTTNKDEMSLHITTPVDIVFTPNKDLWTRCIVIEASDVIPADQFQIKNRPSVDKNGLSDGDAGFNATDGLLTSATGMSWFPGYALDPETGERLNMMFAEDSRFVGENGDDMLWNPTGNSLASNTFDRSNPQLNEVIAGGRHYLYVLRNQTKALEKNNEMPSYDYGEFARANIGATSRKVMTSVNWATIPLIDESFMLPYSQGYIPTETRVELRLKKAYLPYAKHGVRDTDEEIEQSLTNQWLSTAGWAPYYQFSSKGLEPTKGDVAIVKENLDLIKVVPNPYNGSAQGYESSKLDTKVKFTNLPSQATIKIYTVNGTLIRQLEKDDSNSTIVEWDLKNRANIPIASGTYIIHINMPGVGEKVLKWFGTMRDVDLQNF